MRIAADHPSETSRTRSLRTKVYLNDAVRSPLRRLWIDKRYYFCQLRLNHADFKANSSCHHILEIAKNYYLEIWVSALILISLITTESWFRVGVLAL